MQKLQELAAGALRQQGPHAMAQMIPRLILPCIYSTTISCNPPAVLFVLSEIHNDSADLF